MILEHSVTAQLCAEVFPYAAVRTSGGEHPVFTLGIWRLKEVEQVCPQPRRSSQIQVPRLQFIAVPCVLLAPLYATRALLMEASA